MGYRGSEGELQEDNQKEPKGNPAVFRVSEPENRRAKQVAQCPC